MWSEHWNTVDPRAERELILRSERPFFQVETEKIQTWCKIRGVGRTGKVWMFSLERYSRTSLDLCAGASSWTSFRFHACLRLVELFCSICSVPKEHSLCSAHPWCSFLPCVIYIAQCKKILSENDEYRYVGPKVGGGESPVFQHFIFTGSLLHGSQEMLWNKHPFFNVIFSFVH